MCRGSAGSTQSNVLQLQTSGPGKSLSMRSFSSRANGSAASAPFQSGKTAVSTLYREWAYREWAYEQIGIAINASSCRSAIHARLQTLFTILHTCGCNVSAQQKQLAATTTYGIALRTIGALLRPELCLCRLSRIRLKSSLPHEGQRPGPAQLCGFRVCRRPIGQATQE